MAQDRIKQEENISGIKASSIDPETLLEALEIARDLQKKSSNTDDQSIKIALGKNRELLFKLLEYLILNMDNPNIDQSLVKFLSKILGVNLSKKKEKEKEEEELEEEVELSEEEKQRRNRLVIYEVYKILNPHRLAGETSLENFINNVRTRGIEEARKYEGADKEQDFDKKELEDLESHKFSFVKSLEAEGFKGKGRGL